MTVLDQRIDQLSDFAATAALDHFATLFAKAPLTQSTDALPEGARGFVTTASNEPARAIPTNEAAAYARSLLKAFARTPAFEPGVANAVEAFKDNNLASRPILAFGTVATLFLIAATTEVEVTIGDVYIHKHAATPELVSAIAEVLRPLSADAEAGGGEKPE